MTKEMPKYEIQGRMLGKEMHIASELFQKAKLFTASVMKNSRSNKVERKWSTPEEINRDSYCACV